MAQEIESKVERNKELVWGQVQSESPIRSQVEMLSRWEYINQKFQEEVVAGGSDWGVFIIKIVFKFMGLNEISCGESVF